MGIIGMSGAYQSEHQPSMRQKTVNGTRWCEDHKDEWCDECSRHAMRVRNDYLGKKIAPRLCDRCKGYTGE